MTLAVYRNALKNGHYAAFAITEHAFALALPGDCCWPHQWYYTPEALWSQPAFRAEKTERFLQRIAENRDGEQLFFGMEAEIAADGSFTLDPLLRPHLDLVIGSIHFLPGTPDPVAEYLHQLDMLLQHDFDILGHPFRLLEEQLGDTRIPEEALVETFRRAAARGVAVEINGHSTCWGDVEILRRSEEYGYRVAFGLDAHHIHELSMYSYFENVVQRSGVELQKLKLFAPAGVVNGCL